MMPTVEPTPVQEMMDDSTPSKPGPSSAIAIDDLWFSYEVATAINESLTIDKSQRGLACEKSEKTRDGGLSVANPRGQYQAALGPGLKIAKKLELAEISMQLPKGARCMLIGANGAGKSTLMNVIGGKHMVDEDCVQVLGKSAFHDTTSQADLALLTGNWTQTVNFVGHNIPYQAMEVSTLIASASAGVDPARVERLTKLLEVNPKWNLTTVSDGQRRRVQIMCKLVKPSAVMLLDEITTDLDLLARQDLLEFLKEESEGRGACIVYCTHIFDGLDGWATHVTYILGGRLRFSEPADALKEIMAVPVAERANGWGELFCAVQRLLRAQRPDFLAMLTSMPAPAASVVAPDASLGVEVKNLTWGYSGASVTALPNLSFSLPRGCLCLLVGANGAGKTTLLRLLGGKHMVPMGQINVLGRPVFHDLALNTLVSMLSGDWTRQVACVGNGVPFQADFSVGEMTDRYVEALVRDGFDAEKLAPRLARLKQLLDLNMEWRLHKVSDGQRRRCQLLLKLLRPSELLLMDEVTTDLDLISRQALLVFLREEAEQRGVTVVYSTHIFDGVDDWPTHILSIKRGALHYCGPLADAPKSAAAATAGGKLSGSLYQMVRGWLDDERAERRAAGLAPPGDANSVQGMDVDSASMAQAAAAPAPKAKYDDPFGGGGGKYARAGHGMYR